MVGVVVLVGIGVKDAVLKGIGKEVSVDDGDVFSEIGVCVLIAAVPTTDVGLIIDDEKLLHAAKVKARNNGTIELLTFFKFPSFYPMVSSRLTRY